MFLLLNCGLSGLMDSDSSRRDTQGGELAPDGGAEWRSRMQADARQKVISKMYACILRLVFGIL